MPLSRPDLPPFAHALVELCVSGGAFLSWLLARLPPLLRLVVSGASPRTGVGLRTSRAKATAALSDRAVGRGGRVRPWGRGPCAGGAYGTCPTHAHAYTRTHHMHMHTHTHAHVHTACTHMHTHMHMHTHTLHMHVSACAVVLWCHVVPQVG